MTATIVWNVSQLDCLPQAEGQTDVVVTAHWQCNGTQVQDGKTYNASVYSTTSFTYTGGSFVPYSQLTQQDVLNWIWASGVDQNATEAAVQQQINNQINPPVVTPALPWATA
jgi:hypothetical protein